MERLRQSLTPHRDLILITALLSLTTFTMGAMQPVLPLYAQSMGASVEQWGLIAAMWAVAMAIGEPFWGWVHDHVDRIAPFYFRVINSSLVFLALTLSPVFWPLYLLNFWRGFSDAAAWPTSRSLVSGAANPARLGLAMGVLATGARLGSALGALVGGQVAHAYGFKHALMLSAVVSLAAGFLILPRYGRPRLARSRAAAGNSPAPRVAHTPLKSRAGQALKLHQPFLVLASITALSSVGWFGAMSYLPFVVTSSLGGNVANVGVILNLSSAVTGVFTIPMGGLGDKLGKRRMVIGGLILTSLSLAGVALADSYALLAACVSIGAIGQAAVRPALDALVSGAASSTVRGRLMGFYGMCEDMGGVMGPLLGSLTWALGGATMAYLSYSLIAGVGSITAIAVIRDRQAQNQSRIAHP